MVYMNSQYFITNNLIYDIGLYNLIYGNIGLFWSMPTYQQKGYTKNHISYMGGDINNKN